MSKSSILPGNPAAAWPGGRDVDALGPSDSSDSGSDVQGERSMSTDADNPGELGGLPVEHGSDSDSAGTGERGSATGEWGRDGADILPDRVIGAPDDASDPDALSEVGELAADEPYEEDGPDEPDAGSQRDPRGR